MNTNFQNQSYSAEEHCNIIDLGAEALLNGDITHKLLMDTCIHLKEFDHARILFNKGEISLDELARTYYLL